ncbi:MAG TPA: VWA domain-containing protein, partial [Nitrospira sp.]|nr:VWA domain-containing protein [Nitrospira sp.]
MLKGRILAGVVLAATLAAAQPVAAVQTNVELIVDDSGSMAQQIGGGRKIDVAKQVFSGLIQDLPRDAQIAVRTYGRQQVYTRRDCHDMELLIPFGPNSPERVIPGVKALRPNGMTPIASSLEEAAKDFVGKEGQNNIIVLLSDGEEDCNGDPCAASQRVHDAGIHLQVNVIGL